MADMPNKERKSHIPRWAKVIGLLLALVFALLGTIRILGLAATRRWERYVAKLEAEGQPMTLKAVDVRRAPLPDEQNGALVIEAIADELNRLKPGSKYVFVLGPGSRRTDFFNGIPRYPIEPTRAFLAQHADLLNHLDQLADKPAGRLEIIHQKNPWATLSPDTMPVRTACKLERAAGILKLIDGDFEGAANAAVLQFHISGTLNEHPSIIGRLVEITCNAFAVTTVEDTLRVGELAEGTMQRLDETIQTRLDGANMKWALWGERAAWGEWCELIAAGELSEAELASYGWESAPLNLLPVSLVRSNQLRGVEMMSCLVDASEDPRALLTTARRLNADSTQMPVTQFLVKGRALSLSRFCEIHVRCLARLLCARAALAAERYRLDTGSLPARLQDLVPEYMAEIPLDPRDGQPLRFVQSQEGIIIYSIGEDGIDDEGFVVEKETGRRGSDEGFRLNRLEHRGLILTDDRQPDEG